MQAKETNKEDQTIQLTHFGVTTVSTRAVTIKGWLKNTNFVVEVTLDEQVLRQMLENILFKKFHEQLGFKK